MLFLPPNQQGQSTEVQDCSSAAVNCVVVCVERTRFVRTPLDVAAEFPGAATFQALAVSDADTPVTYTWFHDGRQLISDDVNVHVDTSAGNLTLLTTDDDDLGEYSCVASNGVSSVSATAKLYLTPHTGLFVCFSTCRDSRTVSSTKVLRE